MEYWKTLISRAFSETWESVMGAPMKGLLMVALVFGVIFIVTRVVVGKEAAHEELISAVVSLVGTILVFTLLFFVNLCFLTPKKIVAERDAVIAAKVAEIAALQKPDVSVKIWQATSLTAKNTETGAFVANFVVWLRVKNIGEPIKVMILGAYLTVDAGDDTEVIEGLLIRPTGDRSVDNPARKSKDVIKLEDSIYVKLKTLVPKNDEVNGFVDVIFPQIISAEELARVGKGKLTIRARDTLDRAYTDTIQLKRGDADPIRHAP